MALLQNYHDSEDKTRFFDDLFKMNNNNTDSVVDDGFFEKLFEEKLTRKTVDSVLESWMMGDKRVSVRKAWEEYLDSDHVVVTPELERRLMQIAPDIVCDNVGRYCGSPEVKLSFSKEDDRVLLVVYVGIHKLEKFNTPIVLDDSYLDIFAKFSMQSLDIDDFDLTHAMFSAQPKAPKILKHASSDSYESATEHALCRAVKVMMAGSFLGHDAVVLKDPTPGAVARMIDAKEIFLSGEEGCDNDEIIRRAHETGHDVQKYVDNKHITYYLGFFDHKIKPEFGSYCGFEINPYSRVLRASNRVTTIQHCDDEDGGGFNMSYYRKNELVAHYFARNPKYFRYKTRKTIPFFSSYNKAYDKCITDQYIFYCSNPFLACFENVNKGGMKKEAFPVGLVPYYEYDKVEEYELEFKGVMVKVEVMSQNGVPVDVKSDLSYFSRMKLLHMVLNYHNLEPPDKTNCVYQKMEHPISGDVYDMQREGYSCELTDTNVELVGRDGFPTDVLIFAWSWKSPRGRFALTRSDAFTYNNDGTFKRYAVYPGKDYGYYSLVRGYVPGCPMGFNCGGSGNVPLEKRKFYSCVMNVKSALIWTDELVNWYRNMTFYTARHYLPDREVNVKEVPFANMTRIGGNFVDVESDDDPD